MKSYPMLLSPIKIGNTVLKSRISYPQAAIHYVQGPEDYPADSFIAWLTGLAKNGAAYIDLEDFSNPEASRPAVPVREMFSTASAST